VILWESWLPAGLLVGCLASFTWTMSRFLMQRLAVLPANG
jgi:hypothetical protein